MPNTTVLCFPPAGAGAAFFRSWTGDASGLRIVPVEFPGREKRFTEPECTDMDALLEVIVPELLEKTADADRVVVLGHCFGAVLGYRALQAMARRSPGLDLTLVVSGSAGPGVAQGDRITGLPDDAFVARVQRTAGYHHPALDEPELRALVLPPLRADVAMQEAHVFDVPERLAVPVLAVRGSRDELVSAEDAATWRSLAGDRFRLAEIDGGHMYLVDHWDALLRLIADATDTAHAVA